MKAYRWSALGVVVLAAVACGGDDTSMMSDYAQDLGRHLDAVQTEHLMHSSEVAAAADMDFIARAEDEHQRRMGDHMSQMDTTMGHMMSGVDGRGAPFDSARFAGMMHDMRSDCDEHRTAMHGAATPDAARMEEARHQDAMRDRIKMMKGQIGTMMGQGNGYMCADGM